MDVRDNIKKAGEVVSGGATRMGQLSQARLQRRKLKSLQDNLATAQQEMGALVFDLIERGEISHAALGEAQAKIYEALALVAAKKAEITKLQLPAEEVGEDVGTSRDAYVERLKAQIGEWSSDIEQLKAATARVSAEARGEYEEQLVRLREQRDLLAAKIGDLQAASDETFAELRQNVQKSWDRAKESFEKAKGRLR